MLSNHSAAEMARNTNRKRCGFKKNAKYLKSHDKIIRAGSTWKPNLSEILFICGIIKVSFDNHMELEI